MACISASPRLAICLALAVLFAGQVRGESRPRYEALFADGQRLEGDDFTGWETTEGRPQLNGQPLLAENNPFVWLRDRSLVPAETPPAAFVETICGDVLPGEVVGFHNAGDPALTSEPDHFLVRPHESLRLQASSDETLIRVVARFVRRVVFDRRASGSYEPSTAFYRDGRSVKFRGARFSSEGVSLLLAEGPVRVGFHELAEIHLPTVDPWEAMFDELAVLSTDGRSRLLQFETTAGLTVTASLARLAVTVHGNPRDPARWVHGVQPAWSLDVLWVYNGTICIRRSFAPSEVPLMRLPASQTEQHSALGGAGFAPQVGRNVRGGPLRSASPDGDGHGPQEYGWGIGVHAASRLTFPLSAPVRAFQALVGVDAAAGSGGCVRARLLLAEGGEQAWQPLFESGYLLGSRPPLGTGEIHFPDSKKADRQLVLEIDPAHEGRPAGADPLDIRDLADWFEPQLLLDDEAVMAEIERRGGGNFEAWKDWNVGVEDGGQLLWTTFWDDTDPPGAFRLGSVALDKPFSLRRKIEIGPSDNWLILLVSRHAGGGEAPRIEVTAEGEPVGEYEIPMRDRGNRAPAPILIPLAPYRGTTDEPRSVEFRITQTAGPTTIPIVWHGVRIAEALPTLYPVFEDRGKFTAVDPQSGGQATIYREDAHSGAASLKVTPAARFRIELKEKIEIRREPKWGQYRHVRFAFRKFGAGRVSLEVEREDADGRPVRFDAGLGEPAHGEAKRVWIGRLPPEWIVITRDLESEFGEMDITSVVVSVPDGEYALFDHIYFGRTQQDLENIPAVATADDVNNRARREALRPLLDTVRPASVAIHFDDGRDGLGTIINRDGEVLTAGHLLIGPGREANLTLADGRQVKAKTLGLSRERDLGLLKIEGPPDWPLLPLGDGGDLSTSDPYVMVVADPLAHDHTSPELQVTRIQSVHRGAVQTIKAESNSITGGALADGRLLGVVYRRSQFGGFWVSRIDRNDPDLGRMRAGEVWGDWRPGTGPVLEATGTPVREGLKLTAVPSGTVAEAAGLKPGDVIQRCEGRSIVSFYDFDELIKGKDAGDEVALTVLRDGESTERRVKLAPRLP